MWDLTPDFNGLAATMRCDEELLPELGRVAWAATRLHSDMHGVLEQLQGSASESAVGLSLADTVRALEVAAEQHAEEPHRSVLIDWCRSVGAAAVRSRDGVVHEIVLGTPLDDGRGIARPPERPPYGRDELVEVTGRLVNAANTLPGVSRSDSQCS